MTVSSHFYGEKRKKKPTRSYTPERFQQQQLRIHMAPWPPAPPVLHVGKPCPAGSALVDVTDVMDGWMDGWMGGTQEWANTRARP